MRVTPSPAALYRLVPPTDPCEWPIAIAWLADPARWTSVAAGLLKHDLFAYLAFMQRVVEGSKAPPTGVLHALFQYLRWGS